MLRALEAKSQNVLVLVICERRDNISILVTYDIANFMWQIPRT